jgi:hypothetical protein
MRVKLAVAFAVLLFASQAHADEVQTAVGPVYIPTGSTITLEQSIPDPWGPELGPGLPSPLPAVLLDFTFADGSGKIITAGVNGELGSIDFMTPVADLSLNWDGPDNYAPWFADNVGDSFFSHPNYGTSGTLDWSGPGILFVNFGSGNGDAGIDSMTYTLDSADPPNVPEPSALLLSGIGLAALIVLKLKA